MTRAAIAVDASGGQVIIRNNLCYSPLTDSVYLYHQPYTAPTPQRRLTAAQFNAAGIGSDTVSSNKGEIRC